VQIVKFGPASPAIVIVYRDDGVAANSFITKLDLSPADLETIQTSGITLDQTIAIPVYDIFFLWAYQRDFHQPIRGPRDPR
jgi:hypothetical protein